MAKETSISSIRMKTNIIHKILVKEGRGYYLCNQAVTPWSHKCRVQWKYVTCKNCLKQKEKK
jgi:hypothetical protein